MWKNINKDLDQVVKWSKMNKMVISQNKMHVRRGKAVTEALGQYKFESEYFLEWGYY